jgi:hypothetical protein
MYQQEIQFFWPLTEQIPLDLDYSNCVKPTLSVAYGTGTTISSFPTGTSWTTTSIRLNEETTTMLVAKKPNLLRRMIYKLIGFTWEVK